MLINIRNKDRNLRKPQVSHALFKEKYHTGLEGNLSARLSVISWFTLLALRFSWNVQTTLLKGPSLNAGDIDSTFDSSTIYI